MMKTKNRKTAIFKYRQHYARGKTILTVILILCFYTRNIHAQTIPNNFWGICYWMPYQYWSTPGSPGGVANYLNIETLLYQAGASWFRIGGNGYDKNGTTVGVPPANNDYVTAIDAVIAVNPNAKFLIQIPFGSGTFTSGNAATLVGILNLRYGNGLYYAIGNEWDLYNSGSPNYTKLYSANDIATHIKNYAAAMKLQDPTIKIVAPALSSFGAVDKNGATIMPILISGSGGVDDITVIVPSKTYYYIDVVDFHTYGGSYGDLSGLNSGNYYTNLAGLIGYPSGGFSTNLSTGTNKLQNLLNTANTNNRTSPSSPLTYAITEMNIDYKNPPLTDQASVSPYDNTVFGLGPRSFFAGQYWADIFSAILQNGTLSTNAKVEFVNPWSIWEHLGDGGGSPTGGYDLGMTKGPASATITPQALSTYWHYQMMANNFSGTYYANSNTYTNYKAFAYKNASEIGVLIMNQGLQSPRGTDNSTQAFTINFNNTPGSSGMDFAFPCSLAVSYTGCSIQKEASMLLKFNLSGTLQSSKTYTLQDALRGASDVGPGTWVGGTKNVNSSIDYTNSRSDNATIYTTVTIAGTSAINPGSIGNNTFQFTSSASISGTSGAFSSGATGNTLCISAADQTCHP